MNRLKLYVSHLLQENVPEKWLIQDNYKKYFVPELNSNFTIEDIHKQRECNYQ